MNNITSIYSAFLRLFPQFKDDIASYRKGEADSIVITRKSVRPRPSYIFTYKSDYNWRLECK